MFSMSVSENPDVEIINAMMKSKCFFMGAEFLNQSKTKNPLQGANLIFLHK